MHTLMHKTAQKQKKRAGDGNRTHVTSLEGWSSTIELHPRKRAVDGTRTRDIHLGKVALYQLSYYRINRGKSREPGNQCGRRDSNSYASRHQILSLARLPFRHARETCPAKAGESDPLEIRTPDTLIKSQVLCQLS